MKFRLNFYSGCLAICSFYLILTLVQAVPKPQAETIAAQAEAASNIDNSYQYRPAAPVSYYNNRAPQQTFRRRNYYTKPNPWYRHYVHPLNCKKYGHKNYYHYYKRPSRPSYPTNNIRRKFEDGTEVEETPKGPLVFSKPKYHHTHMRRPHGNKG